VVEKLNKSTLENSLGVFSSENKFDTSLGGCIPGQMVDLVCQLWNHVHHWIKTGDQRAGQMSRIC
jgi:hypothetical protein